MNIRKMVLVVAAGLAVFSVGVAKEAAQSELDAQIASLEDTVAKLEKRVQRLKDVDQVEVLVSAYGYYLDKQMWDQFADLFAENGTMEIAQRGVYVGKPSLRKALHLFGEQFIEPGRLHNHIQLQPVITVSDDGNTAWVRNRVFSELGQYNGRGSWSGQTYENEFVKENGVWKFKKDHTFTTYFAEYGKGWAFAPGPAPKVSDKIPPDQPPSEFFEAFPKVYIPKFHYKHPVTGAEIQVPVIKGAAQ
jgi:hypothetical protein